MEMFQEMNEVQHDKDDQGYHPVKVTPRMLAIARDTLKMKVAIVQWKKECNLKLKSREDARKKEIEKEEEQRKKTLTDKQRKSVLTNLQIRIADDVKKARVVSGEMKEWKLVFKDEAIAVEALEEVCAKPWPEMASKEVCAFFNVCPSLIPSQKIEAQEQLLVDLYRRADPEVASLAFLWGAYEPKCAHFTARIVI